jgi:hypothetical protein
MRGTKLSILWIFCVPLANFHLEETRFEQIVMAKGGEPS